MLHGDAASDGLYGDPTEESDPRLFARSGVVGDCSLLLLPRAGERDCRLRMLRVEDRPRGLPSPSSSLAERMALRRRRSRITRGVSSPIIDSSALISDCVLLLRRAEPGVDRPERGECIEHGVLCAECIEHAEWGVRGVTGELGVRGTTPAGDVRGEPSLCPLCAPMVTALVDGVPLSAFAPTVPVASPRSCCTRGEGGWS